MEYVSAGSGDRSMSRREFLVHLNGPNFAGPTVAIAQRRACLRTVAASTARARHHRRELIE